VINCYLRRVKEVIYFPAYSWVLSLWLVVSRVCRYVRAINRLACGRGPPGPRACAVLGVRKHARRGAIDSAECIIQSRFAIRVDSVPSCKLGSARRRPRVACVYLSVCLYVR